MPASNLTVLGIDPGLGRVGFAVVHARPHEPLLREYGVIETSRALSVPERLSVIHTRVLRLLKRTGADRIAVERLFFSKNVRTAMVVGEARGVVLLAAAEAGVPVVELTPSAVKQSVTGYGAAEKGQVQRMLQAQFHLKKLPRPDDAADAIALAVCGLQKSLI